MFFIFKISVHIFGSDEPIFVKSLKPPAEKLISSFFIIPNAVLTIVKAIKCGR